MPKLKRSAFERFKLSLAVCLLRQLVPPHRYALAAWLACRHDEAERLTLNARIERLPDGDQRQVRSLVDFLLCAPGPERRGLAWQVQAVRLLPDPNTPARLYYLEKTGELD